MNEAEMLEELKSLESFVVLKYFPFQATHEYRMSLPPGIFREAFARTVGGLFRDEYMWSDREIFDLFYRSYKENTNLERALIDALVRYEYDKKIS